MSELAAEKEQEINSLHAEYLEAYDDLMVFQDAHDIVGRTVDHWRELSRLSDLCGLAKFKYDTAETRRFVV